MFGVTTRCVDRARATLDDLARQRAEVEVLVFHATGVGGQAMERLIRDGLIDAVLDLTTTELADELVGGILSSGPDRLKAAVARGIPQVVSVGALDMVNFGPRSTVPERFSGRTFHVHNPSVTLMRTTPAENAELGARMAAILARPPRRRWCCSRSAACRRSTCPARRGTTRPRTRPSSARSARGWRAIRSCRSSSGPRRSTTPPLPTRRPGGYTRSSPESLPCSPDGMTR